MKIEDMKQLLSKISNVSTACMTIEKDMTVGKGSYSYKAVSDLSVTKAVKIAEKEQGIISIPISQELVKTETLKTINSSNKEVLTFVDIVKLTLRIYDLDTEKYIEVTAFGRGLDSGDKGFGKASTYARKLALLNAYKIATGEDPDADPSKNITTPQAINEKEVMVKDYLIKNQAYMNEVLGHFNVGSVDDLNNENLITIFNNLTRKKLI